MKSLIGTITTYLLKLVCPILFWASGRLRLGEVQLAGVRPPFLLVANHQTEMDPFYIGVHVPGRISFVATDSLFRNPFMDYIMSALGSIPKSKFDVDPSCIRRMLESVKRGWSVALFPEGQRSMAGYTDAIVPGSRLAKWLDVPLVVAKLQGGFWPALLGLLGQARPLRPQHEAAVLARGRSGSSGGQIRRPWWTPYATATSVDPHPAPPQVQGHEQGPRAAQHHVRVPRMWRVRLLPYQGRPQHV